MLLRQLLASGSVYLWHSKQKLTTYTIWGHPFITSHFKGGRGSSVTLCDKGAGVVLNFVTSRFNYYNLIVKTRTWKYYRKSQNILDVKLYSCHTREGKVSQM